MSYWASRVTGVEGELRRAAFGDLLAPAAVLLAAPDSARSRLLAAIVSGAQGRYAAAATWLGELGRGADPVLAALALTTLASHRRQLGGHAAALRLDARALRLASGAGGGEDLDGLDGRGAFVDALLGLAADNLGTGRLSAARRLLAAAAPLASGWRARVRTGWVTAEIELASGRPEAAGAPAEAALELATAASARRHVIKSQLVLAAALIAAGAPARAEELVSAALAEAEKFELRSLAWPGALLAGQLWPSASQYRFRVDAVLHAVLLRSDAEGRILARESAWVPV
ncbi:hypothetical protein [Amycolatopsis taiwanensis]|uniref:hypothetical protein n=1 Tax=Amycolatopsis taiwanensis TaxID=342230 RepID=UPI00069434B2